MMDIEALRATLRTLVGEAHVLTDGDLTAYEQDWRKRERGRALAVVRILNRMAQQAQTAIIVVTHDEKIIPTFKRIYQIRDGETIEVKGEGRSVD